MRSVAASMVLLALTLAAACGGTKGATPPAQATLSDSADKVFWGVRHLMVEAGVKKGQLFADTAYAMDGNTRYELRGVRLILFDSTGATSATLTSREATYSTVDARMEARGNVVVITADGKRLDTQQMLYDQRLDMIKSDSAFVMVEPTQRIEGASFTSDSRLQDLTCIQCRYTSISGERPAAALSRTDTLGTWEPRNQ